MNPVQIVQRTYHELSSRVKNGVISISLRTPTLVGTVQDDPFDCWVAETIRHALPDIEVFHAGKLTTPDLVLRHKPSNSLLGIEVKKLIQKTGGGDSRGLTLDYNSCLPCGKTLIKVGKNTVEVPCFYFFALLSQDSTSIVTSILMDGDFLNYDFKLHKDAKYANQSEYAHGPYGEGSVRHRRMYTYPNPLNYKLNFFHLRHLLVVKRHDLAFFAANSVACTDVIIRDDIYNHSFQYVVLDQAGMRDSSSPLDNLPFRKDIFQACKDRRSKDRTVSMPQLPE